MKRKTDLKLELWQFFANLTIEPVLWLILMACLCHLASSLINTNDEDEDLAIHCQACIYRSGSLLLISYLSLKAVQLYRAPNHFRTISDVCGSGCSLSILYADLKAVPPCQVFIWGSRQSNRAKFLSRP